MSESEAVAAFRDLTLRFPDTGDAPMRRAVLAHLDALTERLATITACAVDVMLDLEARVQAEYNGPDDVHPAMAARYRRDMQPVRDLRAALGIAEGTA
jgi:hypothetical protein